MSTELHLTEDALALHLSLQRLEGLVDIVVADENLHVELLFDQAVDRPDSQAARAIGICRRNPQHEPSVDRWKSLPISTTAANWKTRDFGTSPQHASACAYI